MDGSGQATETQERADPAAGSGGVARGRIVRDQIAQPADKIGLCYPRLVRIKGTALHVRGLDFWDGTPIVDIKGYFPRDETKAGATVPAWLTDLWNAFDMEKAGSATIPVALDEVETERGRVVFRPSMMADAPGALDYINTLSREQTFILMQGEQLTLADEIAYFQGQFRQRREAGDAVHIVAVAGDEIVGIGQTGRESRVFRHTARLGISIANEWRGSVSVGGRWTC